MLLEPGQNHRTGLIRRVGFRENSREWTHFDQRVEAARFSSITDVRPGRLSKSSLDVYHPFIEAPLQRPPPDSKPRHDPAIDNDQPT